MVYTKPRLVVLQGGKAEPNMKISAAKAHDSALAVRVAEIHERMERMAKRTSNPKMFMDRISRHFTTKKANSVCEREGQLDSLLERLKIFEAAFDAYMCTNGGKALSAMEILVVVEQISDSSNAHSQSSGGSNRPPPESA